VAGLVLFLSLPGRARAQTSSPEQSSVKSITLSFKLDPRLQNATYGGEKWVSVPYRGANAQDTVEVRAQGLDVNGRPTKIDPEWIPSDPEMVTVTPARGEQVKITVKRAGESKLKISAQGLSRELILKATYLGKSIQVEITQPAPPKSAEAAPAFPSRQAKVSYALGMNLAQTLRRASVEVDPDLVIQGFRDAESGGPTLLSEQELDAVMVNLPREVRKNQIDLEAEKRREMAERNKQEGEAFLAENRKREGVVTLPSGLQYQIVKAGDGKTPAAGDSVVCKYRGTFVNGLVFDKSFEKRPVTFPIRGVIKGWAEALTRMPAGSKWRLFVPSDLAYGERGVRGARVRKGPPGIEIEPNTTLIFDIELVDVQEPSKSSGTIAAHDPAAERAE
jgi:FKBP-type peptidyl-prolyl cis-trans isomerase FklB